MTASVLKQLKSCWCLPKTPIVLLFRRGEWRVELATGSLFYPSLLLSAHLGFLCMTRSSLGPYHCRPLFFMPAFVFCGIPACPLCSIIFSPHSLWRESFLFLKVPCLQWEILGLIHLDNNGSTASSSGSLVSLNFWQISSRALQITLLREKLCCCLTAKHLILAQDCQ